MTVFATWLQGEIDARGWDQRTAAKYINVRESTVHNWLHKGKRPSTKHAIQIALALKIPVTTVMGAAGYDVTMPGTEEARAVERVQILAQLPQFAEVIDLLARQPPHEQAVYIDLIRRLLLPPGGADPKSN